MQSRLPLDPAALRQLARQVLDAEGVHQADLSISLVDDAAIAALNAAYLNHLGPTDVITFPLSAPHSEPLAGEIVISVETAVREAACRGLDPTDELRLYLVHGLLHLCGYDDRDPADRRAMDARQRLLLAQVPQPAEASP